ncbi:uncharacterized protein LOC144902215 [Branchiostoma floridae x Branchiostoma belcheri]
MQAVWGFMSVGDGYSNMNEVMSVMGIPSPSERTFLDTENTIGGMWEKELADEILAAGKEEKAHAEAMGLYDEGIPAISVIADGGWSARSNSHRYNAKSGVGVIIGKHTKKLLYIGVRNKFCAVCAVAEGKHEQAKEHQCFKNWNASSGAMEADIVALGFACSEAMHGVRYVGLIGDGDSNTMAKIIEEVPYGRRVKKVERANHAIRNYRKNLHSLVDSNPQFKGRSGLTQLRIKKISAGARAAIRMHSRTKNVQALQRDIRNGPYHVFGDHRKCSSSFCKHKQSQEAQVQQAETSQNSTPTTPQTSTSDNSTPETTTPQTSSTDFGLNHVADLVDDIVSESVTPEDEEDARVGESSYLLDSLPEGLMLGIQKCADRLFSIAPKMIENETSNPAENFMSVNAKFNGGKQIMRGQKGSYQHRCHGAGLAVQNGPQWHEHVWQKCFNVPANEVLKTYCRKLDKKRTRDRKRKGTDKSKEARRKSKYAKNTGPDCHYGPNAQQPEVDSATLSKLCEQVSSRLSVTGEEQAMYEEKTRQQASSSLWGNLRKERLTASKFGELCKRRRTTPCARIVTDMLYKGPITSAALRWGKVHEDDAIKAYVEQTGHKVSPCGLIISTEHGFLAATPDGKVEQSNGEIGLLEVKCPYSAVKGPQPLTPLEAAKQFKSFPLQEVNGTLQLPKKHDYYYQIQGQLKIAKLQWADFAVWTPAGIHIQRISQDEVFWNTAMFPNLKWFFYNCMLPELACPRYPHMPLREPPEVVDAAAKRQSGKVGLPLIVFCSHNTGEYTYLAMTYLSFSAGPTRLFTYLV